MNSPRSTFEDLDVWQLSRGLRRRFSELVKLLPTEERYRLTDQMIRASRSITANLAEGYGRYHYQENIQFCRQARGSLFELIDHLTVALDEKYVAEKDFLEMKASIHIVIKKINGYIHYLNQQKLNHSTI